MKEEQIKKKKHNHQGSAYTMYLFFVRTSLMPNVTQTLRITIIYSKMAKHIRSHFASCYIHPIPEDHFSVAGIYYSLD
ncbi:uncharacterized protein DS421_11g334440 [Arachis hypogaea]|nr:uncharacterized protein DS421_11g334440 [Arachis hypogaea]